MAFVELRSEPFAPTATKTLFPNPMLVNTSGDRRPEKFQSTALVEVRKPDPPATSSTPTISPFADMRSRMTCPVAESLRIQLVPSIEDNMPPVQLQVLPFMMKKWPVARKLPPT